MIDNGKVGHSGIETIILVVVLVLLELSNIIFMGSTLNLIVSIPEILVVLYVLYVKNDVQSAFLLHLLFSLTGFDPTSALSELEMFSYTKVKLVGPLTISYIILGLIFIKVFRTGINKKAKITLSYEYYSLAKILFIYATFVGIIGLSFLGYRIGDFIPRFLYLLVGTLFLSIFLRLYSPSFLKKSYYYVFCLILASPIASFISYSVLNISSTYSVFEVFIYNEVFWLSPVLLLALFYKKEEYRGLAFISLVFYLMCLLVAGRGGHFFTMAISLVMIAYLVYFSKEHKHGAIANVFKIALPLSIMAVVTYFGTQEGTGSLATMKFNEMMSLLEALTFVGGNTLDLSSISDSPYIRIAEVFNIIANGFHNPFGLLFGKGYGGTFTDSLGMFANLDLTNGAYPIEVVSSGRYGTPHSFLPSILLHHGLIGLILIVRVALKFLKKLSYTPFVFAAFVLFLWTFYFNTNLILALSFALCASEYKIQYNNSTVKYKKEEYLK